MNSSEPVTGQPIRVLISCHFQLFADGVSELLRADERVVLLGTACDSRRLAEGLAAEPDVVITDTFMGECLFHQFHPAAPPKVLLINDCPGLTTLDREVPALLQKGLAGILSPVADRFLLRKAVRALAAGELWLDNETVRKTLCRQNSKGIPSKLTNRELVILEHLQEGLSNKEIADKLFISEHTVKSHCRSLFRKYGVSSRVQLVLASSPNHP